MSDATQAPTALILVVDDDRTLRALLRLAMEEEGYQVAEASQGEQCLAEFSRLQPAMVLLDAVMPVMDGFECCTQLRQLPAGEHTPVLMITVLDDGDSVDRAFEAGATDYITKPIHWAVLRQRVCRLLQGTQAQQQVTQMREQLHHQQQREQLFRGIAQCLSQPLCTQEMLQGSLEDIKTFLQIEGVGIAPAATSITFSSRNSQGYSVLEMLDWQTLYLPELVNGIAISIEDTQPAGLPAAIQALTPFKIQALLLHPIFLKGEFWGVIAAYQSQCRHWNLRDKELLAELGGLMALIIEQFVCCLSEDLDKNNEVEQN